MYYGLSNFYQNHRRYVKSRDDSQLNGDMESLLVTLTRLFNNTGRRSHGAFENALSHCETSAPVISAREHEILTSGAINPEMVY